MSLQQTLAGSAKLSGVGLHSGNRVNMTLMPASADTGIRFRRVDLAGRPEVEAIIDNLHQTNRSTTLSKGNIKIHTVEHILSTFAGMGVDNAVVELDSNEPPIGDGSARAYYKLVEQSGIEKLDKPLKPFALSRPVEVREEDSLVSVFPHDGLRISCTSSDNQGRFTQYYSLDITPDSWVKELSEARTFCFFEEIEALIKNGLIRGGSLENAVVLREDAVLTTEPLRYPEEFVRHKILDILGDLALLGRPLLGHVIALRPSHRLNCELARRLVTELRQTTPAVLPVPASVPVEPAEELEGEGAMDIDEIMQSVPHRYPFLMVDRVLKFKDNRLVARKNVSINEHYFQGHFPQHAVMPGVLQLEAIAQVAGLIMFRRMKTLAKVAYFMAADNVKWRKPVRPGDVMIVDVEVTKFRGKIGKAKGVCLVDGEVVSEANVTFMVADA